MTKQERKEQQRERKAQSKLITITRKQVRASYAKNGGRF